MDNSHDNITEKNDITELANQQIETYRRQSAELVSHYNREKSALDGYRGRQLLELLQNADDAGVGDNEDCGFVIDLNRERLIVANTGKPFTKKGITSLVISDCSPKQLERNRFIGCKGLGFRSVLTWTDQPLISSGNYEVSFDRDLAITIVQALTEKNPGLLDTIKPFLESGQDCPVAAMRFPTIPHDSDSRLLEAKQYRAQGFDTVVVIPIPREKIGDAIYREVYEQLNGLQTNCLLFCQHLVDIKITGDLEKHWKLLREPHEKGHTSVIIQDNDGEPELWEVYRQADKVSENTSQMHLSGRRDYEVAIAVPQRPIENPQGSLYVFFPTGEKLPCGLVMHATLETTDDRNHFVDHPSNREVLRGLAKLVAQTIEKESMLSSSSRALELLSGIEQADSSLTSLGFIDSLIEECGKRKIFPRIDSYLGSRTEVKRAPNQDWLDLVSKDYFPEVMSISAENFNGILDLFELGWFESEILKSRLKSQLLNESRTMAGEIVGKLLITGQLKKIGADGLIISNEGQLVDGLCFFTPLERLPAIPAWASSIRFVDAEFQKGLLTGSNINNLRTLSAYLNASHCEIQEYSLDPVARSLIGLVEGVPENDDVALLSRWTELLHWLFEAWRDTHTSLSQLVIKVVTTKRSLRRANTCYLGPRYPGGQIVWRLYKVFDEDEFVGDPFENGLNDIPISEIERFLLAAGVSAMPRYTKFRSGEDYELFKESVVDQLYYPRTIQSEMCRTPTEVRKICRDYEIDDILIPDRWIRLLKEGDAAAIIGYLLSFGGLIAEENDSHATFYSRMGNQLKLWPDVSVPILNAALFFLRGLDWIPGEDGNRHRPSGIMISNQGARILRGIYSRHSIDTKDILISMYGGRQALESLFTRLGVVSSLEALNGQSLYELLWSLPERDPKGVMSPGIYRTLVDSNNHSDESSYRDIFIKNGKMWGKHKGSESYIPVQQLRYNANLSVTKPIESYIPLVDIPTRKNSSVIQDIFGVVPLTSKEIDINFVPEGTIYSESSEDANRRLHLAIPYIYALRLADTMDANNRELNLLRKANLRVCTRVEISAKLPGDINEKITLDESGDSIVIDTGLFIVGEYRENGPGFLTFWLSVAELVAQLLGPDVASEAGGILRCRTTSEMLEVLHVRLGLIADQKLKEANDRFDETFKEDTEEQYRPIPPAKPTEPPYQTVKPATEATEPPYPTTESKEPEETSSKPTIGTEFLPVKGPSEGPPKKRKLVITVSGGGGGSGGRGPIATEDITFKVVEAFEKDQSRFIILVSHLHGSDAFGCDLLSVASEAIRDEAVRQHVVNESDIMRYIEVKGRSSRTGDIELVDNEYRAAEQKTNRYFIYRVYVDPTHDRHYEIAVLPNPTNSKAVRTVTRFNLVEGSGASWFKCSDVPEEQESQCAIDETLSET